MATEFENDFGFSFADEWEAAQPQVAQTTTTMEKAQSEKMKALESLILPLLYNLMKNPEKPYIKWENRTQVIQEQINKITAITRG